MDLFVILIIAAMIVLNGLFASYELALASVSLGRLQTLADEKRAGATAALAMKQRLEASLAVVQLGITLVGAIAAATGGFNAGEELAPRMAVAWGISDTLAEVLAITFVVIPLAAITIVIGELVPKVFALRNCELVVLVLSPGMRLFAAVTFPAVWFFEGTTKAAIHLTERLLPGKRSPDQEAALRELRAQVNLLRASQIIGLQEERIILQASRLSGMTVGQIIVPIEDVVVLSADATLSENLVIAHLDLHTRFPVAERTHDPQSIVGYVTFKEMMLLAKTNPGNPILREIVRPLISLPEDLRVSDALRRMLAEQHHLALVRDPQDKVLGILTQEDVFEELVGDIQDEFDRLPRHLSPMGQEWVVGGGAPLQSLREALQRPDLGDDLPPQASVNDWLKDGDDRRFRGGDVLQKEGVWLLVRKVRRKQISEVLIDPTGRRLAGSSKTASDPLGAGKA